MTSRENQEFCLPWVPEVYFLLSPEESRRKPRHRSAEEPVSGCLKLPSFYLLGLHSPIYLDNGSLEPGYILSNKCQKLMQQYLRSVLDMYGLLTKCEVKIAGYWPSSFFACLWTETMSRSINSQKKNEANIQSS